MEDLKKTIEIINEMIFVAERSNELCPWRELSLEYEKEDLDNEFGSELEGDSENMGGQIIASGKHISQENYNIVIRILVEGLESKKLELIKKMQSL